MLHALHESIERQARIRDVEVRTYYSAIERGREGVKGIRLSVKRMNYSNDHYSNLSMPLMRGRTISPKWGHSYHIRGIAQNLSGGGDCKLTVLHDRAGLPRGSCPAFEMPLSRWVAPLTIVLVFLLGVSLLSERRRK